MEKAAKAGSLAGVRWEYVLGCCAALLAPAVAHSVPAQEPAGGAAPVVLAQAGGEPSMRVRLQASSLPRIDGQDPAFQSSRIDLSLTPLNLAGSGLGPVLGMASISPGVQGVGLQPRTSIDLGLRWTQRLQSQRQVDITAWRRMNSPDDAYTLVQMREPVYGARVEMQLKPANATSIAFDAAGFVGLQLEGGGRITFKRKEGRPMVYYRTSF